MATVLGLALKISADASGLPKSLTPVERALNTLGDMASKSSKLFDQFLGSTSGAAQAQKQVATDVAFLTSALKTGQITAKQFSEEFAGIQAAATKTAEAFAEGVRVTEQYRTEEERTAIELERIQKLLDQRAITEETAARARADATGETQRATEATAAAAKQLDAAIAEGARLNEQYASAEEKTAAAIERTKQLRESGAITLDTFTKRMADLTGETAMLAEAEARRADAFAEGARITERNRTEEEKRASAIARLNELFELGAIGQREYNAEMMQATGLNAQMAAAEEERAALSARATAIIEANLTAQEQAQNRYDQEIAEYNRLRAAGLLGEEDFAKAVQRSADSFAKATVAAGKYGNEVKDAGKAGTLQFNELSGILAALPGPLGNIAGRLSGLSSAAEGLGRIFSGGLSSGISGIAASFAGMVNPVTAGLAAVAAFGAAATSVASGLANLEAETEKLQNAADKLGVSFGFIETLQQAAEMSGVAFDSVNSAMTRLLKTLAGADEESKQATAALGRLGVSLDDLNGKNSEDQLRLIAQRLQAIEDPAKRAAAATAIFGKSGADILPFFQNLGIAEQTLTRFNARLSEIDVARVLALGDSFDAVKASLTGVGNELLTPFIGVTQSLSDGLASAIATFGRSIGSVLDIFSPLTSAVGAAGNLFLQFGSILGNLIGAALEPFAASGRAVSGAIDAISRTVTAIAGRINDAIIGFREFFKFEGIAASFRDTFSQIGEVASRVGVIVTEFAKVVGESIGRVGAVIGQSIAQFLEFTGLGSVISGFASTVGGAFGQLWNTIKSIVSGIGGFIERVLKFAEDWLGIKQDVAEPVVATVEVNDGGAIEALVAESKTLGTTIDGITKSVSDAIDESSKFGQAGFDAALKYQTAIGDLKDKLAAGLFNEETFKREAAKAGEAYKAEIERMQAQATFDLQESEETKKTLENLQAQISKVVEGAQQFGKAGFDAAAQFQDKLRELGKQFEDGRINAASLADETARATAEYNKQIEGLKQIEDLQKSIADADKQRLDQLIASNNENKQGETDLEFVLRQQLKLEEEIRKQREAGNVFAADAATARLAQLDQTRAKLEEQQQALDQGFGEGFAKAFDATNKSIGDLINKAAQFGSVGAQAALQLQAGVAKAQEQAKDGILTAETFQKEVDRQRAIFDERLAAAQRVEDFIRSKLDERQKAEFDAVAKLEERKKEAARNVEALEAKIAETKKQNEAARESGDLKAARASATRLRDLQQAQLAEKKIADDRAGGPQQFRRQIDTSLGDFQSFITRSNDMFLKSIQDTYAGANAALAQSAQTYAELERRRQEMLRPDTRAVQVADIRTAEGAAMVTDLAAASQDPALIQARMQTKLLQQIAAGITGASENYYNQPVSIVGAALVG